MADFDSLLDELRAVRADGQRIPSYSVDDTAVLVDGIEQLQARVAELESRLATRPDRGVLMGRGLELEVRSQENLSPQIGPLIMTPSVNEDYWSYRVRLTDRQAVIGFPKFHTIGIGFAVEEDWNTNLPFSCGTEEIYEHIEHNRGDASITREDCIAAIALIQERARRDRGVTS